MDRLTWIVAAIAVVIVVTLAAGITMMPFPGAGPSVTGPTGNSYNGVVPADKLLRVPATSIYPGAVPAGLNPHMQNPLASDPDAAARGMRDFAAFNCSGCHAANGGGGMAPALSDDKWRYGSSPGQIYISIAQGRGAGMPAWGAMLPDRTIWELVSYIESISEKPGATFGMTTSAMPQTEVVEQIPAERMKTTTPWAFTEPRPPKGARPGG